MIASRAFKQRSYVLEHGDLCSVSELCLDGDLAAID